MLLLFSISHWTLDSLSFNLFLFPMAEQFVNDEVLVASALRRSSYFTLAIQSAQIKVISIYHQTVLDVIKYLIQIFELYKETWSHFSFFALCRFRWYKMIIFYNSQWALEDFLMSCALSDDIHYVQFSSHLSLTFLFNCKILKFEIYLPSVTGMKCTLM